MKRKHLHGQRIALTGEASRKLREHEPHPVRALAGAAKFRSHVLPHRRLRIDEALKVERAHLASIRRLAHCATAQALA
jgi:hypothetical protein